MQRQTRDLYSGKPWRNAGVSHGVMIEIRIDLIDTPEKAQAMAGIGES